MLPLRDAPSSRASLSAWIVVALVLGFAAWDALTQGRHIVDLSQSYGVTVDAPVRQDDSPTGYAEGKRSMVLPAGAADAAHWVMHTQTMLAEEGWRIRHVDFDNAPNGREVHWALPFRSWLGLLAWIDHAVSGRPLGISVEYATLTAGPVMLVVLLVLLTPLLTRHFSPVAAMLVALGVVATYPFYIDFIPGRADHHGLANICGLFTVLGVVIGSSTAPRRWCAVSAVAGGIGLWISAATQVPVLAGVGLSVVGAAWIARGSRALAWLEEPGLFRRWGVIGGAVSVAAYLLEYFPSHFGMRLEVNHPLYALAWLGTGEVLRVVVRGIRDGRGALGQRDLLLAGLGAIAVAVLPVTILLTRATTFTVADPFIWKIHALYIGEFQGLARLFSAKGVSLNLISMCLPFLLLVPAGWRIARARGDVESRALLGLAAGPALLAWLMGWEQVRWLGLAFALSIPLIAVLFRTPVTTAPGANRFSPTWAIAGGLLFLPGLIGIAQHLTGDTVYSEAEVRSLVERDVAHWLRQRAGNARVVVASAPSATTRLISYGGLNGLGTLYWENAEGMKHTAELFAAPNAAAAHALVQRWGITHIVFFSWDAFEVALAKLHRGLPAEAPIPGDMFIANLLGAPAPPPWLRAIPLTLPANPALDGQHVRIWEVVPEQTAPQSAAHAMSFALEMGQRELAARLAPVLDGYRDDLLAQAMLAGIASRQRDAALFSTALQRVLTLLPRAGALPLEDHLPVVLVLAVGQQTAPAQAQLRAAMAKVDPASLRHLTPGSLSDLLTLSEALDVPFPTPALKTLTQQLVPPIKRQ